MSSKIQTLTIIKPQSAFSINLSEIWRFRELLYIFAWRDIKVRYKQTVLGVAWAVFQPLTTMVIFSFFFGKLAGIPSGNLPYPLFVFIGLTVWTFFSSSLSHSSTSLVDNSQIIKKVYFPRLIIPLSSLVTSAIDLGITSLFLFFLIVVNRVSPNPLLIAILPLLFLITLLTTGGLGMFLSAINVKYRDVRYILPFFIQILMFLTPVIYPSTIIAAQHKWVLALNPLTSVIEITREFVGGGNNINWGLLVTASLIALSIFIAGLFYFRKTEHFFADIA